MLKKAVRVINSDSEKRKIQSYLKNGRKPWTKGYSEYKTKYILDIISSSEKLNSFTTKNLPEGYGLGLDERSVEYPWIISKISINEGRILDAGSTFNFDFIVEHPLIKKKDLTIYTFFPEKNCFFKNRINYVFGDLRGMYFKAESFDEIVSQSTIEHIDMDNSIYGYKENKSGKGKSFEYVRAVEEMIRVLKSKGKLLLTFPFGKYEDHGFFQQFDEEMLKKILDIFRDKGEFYTDYFKYEKSGWRFADNTDLSKVESYNPHTGKGKGEDGAAHCRSICCIEFIKH